MEAVKNFTGQIIGFIDDHGDTIYAKNFYGQILGYYDKYQDRTYEFGGKMLCTGDGTMGLVMRGL